MDYFYKPPAQHPLECKALEKNYMNWLMQKALNDNVQANKCILSNVSACSKTIAFISFMFMLVSRVCQRLILL